MGKQSQCPGCKEKFGNGRPYSAHLALCKFLGSAADIALKKHKINTAKKLELKRRDIAARRELLLERSGNEEMEIEALPEALPDIVLPPQRSPSPPPRPSGRPNRRIRLPRRYQDDLPPNPNPPIIPIPEADDELVQPADYVPPEAMELPKSSLFCTEKNSFGVYRKYLLGPPTITPDESFTLSSVSDSISIARDPADSRSNASWWSSFGSSEESVEKEALNYYAPFLNPSTFLLMSWYYNGSSVKSYADVDKLVHNVIRHEDFKASHFGPTFSTAREAERMDKNQVSTLTRTRYNSESVPFRTEDGWIKGRVSIPVPCDGYRFPSEEDAPRFVVDGVWYRRPLEVIKRAFTEPAAEKFHTTPFKEYWKPSEDEPEERVYSETFTGDVFNEQYEDLRKTHREGLNAELEPFIAGIMFYSDATHLTSFGTASLYPLYMYIGNQSQYTRAKPSEFTAHHIAYIPKVFKMFVVSYLSNGD
jgi:Plavaka transposase